MDNKFYLKSIAVNFVLTCLISILLLLVEVNWGFAFALGSLAHLTPNVIFFALAWLSDVNQTVVKGIAIRYFVVIFIKYLIIISLFSVGLGYFKFPLLPLLAGYFVSLIYQVLHALFAKQTAI